MAKLQANHRPRHWQMAAGKIAIMLAMLIAAVPARAAEFAVTTDTDIPFIVVVGQINRGDDVRFRNIAAPHRRAVVVLAGPGGNLDAGLEIGRIINRAGYYTLAAPGTCASACALAWLGGARRIMTPTSRVGFHAGFRRDDGTPTEDGAANAIIGRYLTQLNYSESAIIFMTSAGPGDMNWLDPERPGQHGIYFEVLDDDRNQRPAAPRTARAAPDGAATGNPQQSAPNIIRDAQPRPAQSRPTPPTASASAPRIAPPAAIRDAVPALPAARLQPAAGAPGPWQMLSGNGVFGVVATSPGSGGADLSYTCISRANCQLVVTAAAMRCRAGDQHDLQLAIDGRAAGAIGECSDDGRHMVIRNGSAYFAAMLRGRSVTVMSEDSEGGAVRFAYHLGTLAQRWREAMVGR